MRWLQSTANWLHALLRKNHAEQELGSELRFHIERQTEENLAAGMSMQEARRAALREFGGVEQVKEECRETRRANHLENLFQDVRYGLRMLVKSPSFTFFAVAVLALGIAANSAIFSIADAVLLQPLPYRDANRLVMVWEDSSAFGFPKDTPAPGNFADWRSRNQVFEDVSATSFGGSFALTGQGNPEKLTGRDVTANLFSVLGVTPALGRDFRPEDDLPGAAPVAILSHGLWLRRFGGDPQIIGKEISLNYEKCAIVGVMKPGFVFPDREAEIWTPARFTKEELANHGSHYLEVVARLKPGVSLQAANADLAVIAKQLEKEYPDSNTKVGAFAVPLREELAGDARPAILMLVGAVCFVLLIACANVANLLLSRATGRRRELAMRLALGATRGRIIRQMLTESILLAIFAGTAGLLLSVWGTKFLASLIPEGIAPMAGVGIDGRVLLFTLAVSLATGILFGIIPASRVSQFHLAPMLQLGGGRGSVGTGGHQLRDALVICEVALAIVLLAGAALLIRSLENLYHLDPGFRADHVLVVHTALSYPRYDSFKRRESFYDQVLEKVEALPGVVTAGYTTWVPLTNPGGASGISIEGRPEPAPGHLLIPNIRIISKDYPVALRVRLVSGRLFNRGDDAGTLLVALINQTMARNYWPGEDAVGKRFRLGSYKETAPWITIVGIVGDVHQAGLDLAARPEMYFPYQQQNNGYDPEYLAVRTSGDPMSVAEEVRQQVWSVDNEQPVAGVMPLEDLVDENLASRKMQASLLGGFAGLALLLVTMGIYAVLSFAVAQRTREIGVRVALGAQPRDVLRMIFSQGFQLFWIGAAIGLAAAFALSRAMQHLLYGVSAYDPASFAGVTLLLAAVALLACYVPARRATRVDPLVALRYE
ncbi:MAG: ABC transporter permease [Candidatus Acidiferrum sp.]